MIPMIPHMVGRLSLQCIGDADARHGGRKILRVPRHQYAAANLGGGEDDGVGRFQSRPFRSEEHTSELQSLMRISYAVFCLKKTKKIDKILIPCKFTTGTKG